MKAVVTCEENGIRFFISAESFCATDIPERAREYRDLTDAALAAARENQDPAWQTQIWEPAYLLANGKLASPVETEKMERLDAMHAAAEKEVAP